MPHDVIRRRRLAGATAAATAALAALALASTTATTAAAVSAAPTGPSSATWPTGGQNLDNSRYQAAETSVGTSNVAQLRPKASWATNGAFTAGGDVSATPALDETRAYFPASNGKLFAVDLATGTTAWSLNIADITGIKPANGATGTDYARATPALFGSTLIIGTQSGKFETPEWAAAHPDLAGAYVIGVNKTSGAVLWKTKIDPHFSAMVTQSAQVYAGTAFVGVASNEEAFANRDLTGGIPYTCCSFRGKMVALDVKTGQVKWQTYMLPGDAGYSGASIWGSTPAIDPARNAVYVTTGNNYSLPADRINCVNSATSFADKQACLPGDYFDAIVALNLSTGAIKWAHRALASDAWNTDCGLPGFSDGGTNPGNCPPEAGPDFDFGQGPMLLRAKIGGKNTDVVGAGEKSGDFTMLNRDTGTVVWKTHVGPGGLTGGLQWGSATDGKRIYVAESNSANLNTPGYWAALDPATGSELWRTTDPGVGIGNQPCAFYPGCTYGQIGIGFGYSAEGPVSVANGVVYACSLNPVGPNMVAMDAATGAIRWTYASGSSCLGGAAVANGTVYWGTGYRSFYPLTTPGDKLFAFSLNGS